MKPNEVMLDLVPINYLSSSHSKGDYSLGITSEGFYFLYNNSLKKQVAIVDIKYTTLSIHSHEVVLHCLEEDIRLSSHQNAKIFKNILRVRERVLKDKSLLTVLVEKDKSLEKYAGDTKKSGFWSGLFGKHESESVRSSRSSNRNSFCKMEVSDKTFVSLISKQIYSFKYSNVKLLHIDGAHGFFFD
jgi:hypothetical protein